MVSARGPGYLELGLAVPFVTSRRTYLHTYVPRMYASAPPAVLAGSYYGFGKELAKIRMACHDGP